MFFFTIISGLFDNLLNFISLPISFINYFYVIYININYDLLILLISYFLENNSKNYILYYLLLWFDLHLIFDFYLFEPFLYLLSYYHFFSFFNILSNAILHVVHYSIGYIAISSFIISLKFIILIALLVFVRGGIPRYRFDYLTKLGWTKFLSLILLSFLVELYLIWIF